MSLTTNYGEDTIKVLKGLEPVKQRPGMFTRTDNPLHIIQEAIDNAVDEALAGFASKIKVTLFADSSIGVEDDGRGIPFGMHSQENISVLELVFTRLHAGGKFDKNNGSAYTFSGGLHGVGVSVTNALSTKLEVQSVRDGKVATLTFSEGDVVTPLQIRERQAGDKRIGTTLRILPNVKYFDDACIPKNDLIHLLRSKAMLLPGITVSLFDESTNTKQNWQFKGGLADYLQQELAADALIPIFATSGYADANNEYFSEGEGAQWCVAFTSEGNLVQESYVNLIPTISGGSHENGLKDGLFQAIKSFIELHSLLPKGLKLTADDIFSRANFVLSAKLLDPQFQGQTKERLTSREAVRLISTLVRSSFDVWLNERVDEAKLLADLVIKAAHNRQRNSKKIEKRKGSGVAVLPGKLTDCESKDLNYNEVFLVEGDSAGGSAKMGRDKENQAVLPLRGKVLNSWEVEKGRLFANNEIHDIAVAIGVEPHSADEPVNLANLRYGKICILSDADVDGSHIQVLLLTLFFKHFPKLIEQGHIYVAKPPLFRVDVVARGKKPAQKVYVLDVQELNRTLDKLRKEGLKETHWTISRFKGLGEMNASQLWDTTLNPDTRRLLQVKLADINDAQTVLTFNHLMGRNEAASRRQLMELFGNQVDLDI